MSNCRLQWFVERVGGFGNLELSAHLGRRAPAGPLAVSRSSPLGGSNALTPATGGVRGPRIARKEAE